MTLDARLLPLTLLALLYPWLAIGSANAQSVEPVPDRPPAFELGFGGQAGVAFGSACVRIESDVISCESLHGLAGVHLAPRWRFSHAWSVGALGSLSWGSGVAGLSRRQWWQLGAQARLYPAARAHPWLWLGSDVGLVVLADRVAPDSVGTSQSYTTTAPALGASLGLRLRASHAAAIDLELRGFVDFFSTGGVPGFAARPSYATQSGVLLSVAMNLLLGS